MKSSTDAGIGGTVVSSFLRLAMQHLIDALLGLLQLLGLADDARWLWLQKRRKKR